MGDGRSLSPIDASRGASFSNSLLERVRPNSYPGVATGNLHTITLLFLFHLVFKCPVSQRFLFTINRKVQNESESRYLFRRAFIFD